MIHQYKNNGYNIVLDVNSGSIHVVDDVVYDVLSLMDEENADRYGEAEFSRIAPRRKRLRRGCRRSP